MIRKQKLYPTKQWRSNIICLIIIFAVGLLVVVLSVFLECYQCPADQNSCLITALGIVMLYLAFSLFVILPIWMSRLAWSSTKVDDDTFTSFVFFKKVCIVQRKQPIYYYKCKIDSSTYTECFILVIGNEPFELRFRNYSPTLLHVYDFKKQIALPFSSYTLSLLGENAFFLGEENFTFKNRIRNKKRERTGDGSLF